VPVNPLSPVDLKAKFLFHGGHSPFAVIEGPKVRESGSALNMRDHSCSQKRSLMDFVRK
jgi:hypothetical protein